MLGSPDEWHRTFGRDVLTGEHGVAEPLQLSELAAAVSIPALALASGEHRGNCVVDVVVVSKYKDMLLVCALKQLDNVRRYCTSLFYRSVASIPHDVAPRRV